MRRILGFLFRGKRALATTPLLLLAIASGVLWLRWRWYHGYSTGTRTGVVRKVSVKGPPYCKFASAELVMAAAGGVLPQGGAIPIGGEVWTFTLDDHSPEGALYKQLEAAERAGKPVTIHYRQDLDNKGKFWQVGCSELPQYYATRIE